MKGGILLIQIVAIDDAKRADIDLPNEPFPLWGKLVPSYQNKHWDFTVEPFPESAISQMCFPDEHYDYYAMRDNTTFLGAYDGEKCVGLIVLQKAFFRYLYVLDLKVSAAYRRQGIGRMLIEKAKETAAVLGYRGLYLLGQDNNLSACLFYLRTGFRIGGLDTEVYNGTSQEGKADIVFYSDI